MNSEKKWNTFLHKILTTVILLLLLGWGFFGFLSNFDLIYQISTNGYGISLKESLPKNSASFFIIFGYLAFIGSMVRVIYDFVGHCCYTEKFDFKIWWPWYIFRPLLGFILGAIFVIIFDKSLFESTSNGISKFPFILSFITGFAVTDAITFLRELSKKIFGIDKDK